MDCKTCKGTNAKDQNQYVLDIMSAQTHASNKRWMIVFAIMAAIILVQGIIIYKQNNRWIDFIKQYDIVDEVTTTTYTQDGKGLNIIGNENEVSSGSDAESGDSSPDNEKEGRKEQGDAETKKAQ